MVRRRHLREEEKALWSMVVRDVAPLHAPRPERSAAGAEEAAAEAEAQAQAQGKRLSPVEKKVPRHKRRLQTVEPLLLVPPALSSATTPPVQVQRDPHPAEGIGQRLPGVDTYSWRTFTDGRMKVERRLDLHGMVAQDAYRRLMEFMDVATVRGLRCVEVVTGLGSGLEGGILRRELPHWLARPDIRQRILGVAYPHAGNKGSVRILLRRRRGQGAS
ncbi:Smr/MutS family protein [Acetobacter farinalis]|uniref:Smr/MutS family protein n=2 Tax=Acetobacter farinalis TaxID=1260984 RepID=A0ABT3Q402_9PROT|nr:Smr/MutS family protein [Acetobacter farinalis]